ncbi:protein tyrosine phosphatase [Bracoviriform facetosae]|uniref:Protein tyrosine phosphatase n=1 Tax=Bracoviriform facetosae TaxID=2083300 RepID=B8PQ78_9VIRU|nr:protein tyrosine phosphatase [Bracoviriform facetosae]ACE75504.1 protein tyrosine phosphatase [Bracoviriform facetosae]
MARCSEHSVQAVMDRKQFKMCGALKLCISASYPNFHHIVQQEYYQITSNQEVDTSGSFESKNKHRKHDIYYVDGFRDKKKFICTENPTENSVEDFFRTLWNKRSYIIVMLSGPLSSNANQCYQYWSKEQGGVIQAGRYQIKTVKIKTINNFVVAELHLTDGIKPSRKIFHFSYSDWTLRDVPSDVTKFFQLILKVNHVSEMGKQALKVHKVQTGPIVLHGNQGSSQIGTFCASDFAVYQMNNMARISLANIMTNIRRQLRSYVISCEQYYFCYDIVLYSLSLIRLDTAITEKNKS